MWKDERYLALQNFLKFPIACALSTSRGRWMFSTTITRLRLFDRRSCIQTQESFTVHSNKKKVQSRENWKKVGRIIIKERKFNSLSTISKITLVLSKVWTLYLDCKHRTKQLKRESFCTKKRKKDQGKRLSRNLVVFVLKLFIVFFLYYKIKTKWIYKLNCFVCF